MNWQDSFYASLPMSEAIFQMFGAGYRQTSGRFGYVARVDLTDKELLAFALKEDLIHIEGLRDQYRRVYATDKIEDVPPEMMQALREEVKLRNEY